MRGTIELIVRITDGQCYATSPQAPGFMFGTSALEELHAGIQDALAFHFDDDGPYDVHEHHYDATWDEL